MPQTLTLASSQSRTLDTTHDTLRALEATTRKAAAQGVDLILFPEAYLGGYPRTCSFGAAVGGRSDAGREQFKQYFQAAVDLGDTPAGAGQAWIDRTLELPRGKKHRGDGTREELERIARETGVFVVTGLVERSGGTLYCGVVYVCPRFGVLGKRRKVMPTGSERLVWGQGSASTLRAVTTEIKGVRLTLASAICWENYMPLLRQSLYAQNVNLWLAPTADARDAWQALMRTVACEGRCFVLSANQCTKRKHLPAWITDSEQAVQSSQKSEVKSNAYEGGVGKSVSEQGTGRARRRSTFCKTNEGHEICIPIVENGEQPAVNGEDTSAIDSSPAPPQNQLVPRAKASSNPQMDASADPEAFVCRGGSSIVSTMGDNLAGPVWEKEDELLIQTVDFEDCERGRLDLDVAGSYSRMDQFKLSVEGLELSPPPF